MAVPAMFNNTPEPGHISWDLFHIQYLGVGYEVAAGSTSDRWVWWRYNDGVPAVETGPLLPSDLTADDLLLFGNKDGISIRIQNSNLIDGELIVDGSIFSAAIAANQVSSNHITTAGLDAGVVKFGVMSGDRIAVNTISGDRMAANSIDVTKLNVGDQTNLASDGGFLDPAMSNWVQADPSYLTRVDSSGAAPYVEVTTASDRSSFIASKNRFPTQYGEEFLVSMEYSTPSTNVESLRFNPGIQVYDFDGASGLWRSYETLSIDPVPLGLRSKVSFGLTARLMAALDSTLLLVRRQRPTKSF